LRAIEPDGARRVRRASCRRTKRDVLRLALRELQRAAPARSTSSRCPPARRSARSRSMSRAARSASPACRPARPARSRQSGAADAALRRGRLRAVRAVQGRPARRK
jgi:hypothetical protein